MTKPRYSKKDMDKIAEFHAWLPTVPADQLHGMLCTAFVCGELQNTDLYRHFQLHLRGFDMRWVKP